MCLRPPFGTFSNDPVEPQHVVQAGLADHRFVPSGRYRAPDQNSSIDGHVLVSDLPVAGAREIASDGSEKGGERVFVVMFQLLRPVRVK